MDYEDMDEDELFEELGRELVGGGSGFGIEDVSGYMNFGKDWFERELPKIRQKFCGSGATKTVTESSAMVEFSTAVDALATMYGHPMFTIVAVLVSRMGLRKLCVDDAT